MERLTGIEPAYQAWEASALPLSYSRRAAEMTAKTPGQDTAEQRDLPYPSRGASPNSNTASTAVVPVPVRVQRHQWRIGSPVSVPRSTDKQVEW